MVDFVERTSTGFFGNLGKAIKGVVAGFILFLLSFVLLWWNEGRTDMSRVATLSKVAPVEKPDPALDGTFVSVTAPLATDSKLEDPEFFHPIEALALFRNVEMYAWVEKKETREEKKIGGGSETVTTYSYVQQWTDKPQDSGSFKDPGARSKGYVNPPQAVPSMSWTAGKASVGGYEFDPREAGLPSAKPVQLTPEAIRGPALAAEQGAVQQSPRPPARLEGNFLFLGTGSLSSPRVGDLRIGFSAVTPGGRVTLFGKQSGAALEPYVHKTQDRLFRVLSGTREEAIAQMAFEHKTTTWVLRLIGFLMMWTGLGLFFGPINAVLDVLPFLGSAGRTLVSIAMFPIALVLTLLTVTVAKIAHSPVALVVVLVLVVGGGILLARRRKRG